MALGKWEKNARAARFLRNDSIYDVRDDSVLGITRNCSTGLELLQMEIARLLGQLIDPYRVNTNRRRKGQVWPKVIIAESRSLCLPFAWNFQRGHRP